MKRARRITFILCAMILSLVQVSLCLGASSNSASTLRKKYQKDGYTCTSIYHQDCSDEGFAGARATNSNYVLFRTSLGQGTTEVTNMAYGGDKLATGYAQYLLKGSPVSEYHYFEQEWATNLGTAIMGASNMKVTVCYAQYSSRGTTYVRLTPFVTDK